MNQDTPPIDSEVTAKPKRASSQTWFTFLRKCVTSVFRALLLLVVVYLMIILVGLFPVNNGFQPTPDGIPVLVISNLVHTDIILPVSNEIIDWRSVFPADYFLADTDRYTHISFGWGDEGFFIQTPEWSDLKLSTAANALLMPSSTCMHVTYLYGDQYQPFGQQVRISAEQYQKLADQIQTSFQLDQQGQPIRLAGSYDLNDAFFRAQGNYHCFNTCNSWAGRVIKAAEVRTPWFSPLPKTIFLWLPK